MVHHYLSVFKLHLISDLYQILPRFLFGRPKTVPRNKLTRRLKTIDPLNTRVFLFRFGRFPVRGTISTPTHHPTRAFRQTKLFKQLLFYRLILNLFRLFPTLFRTRLEYNNLFLFTFLTRFQLVSALSENTPNLQTHHFVHFLLRTSDPPNK